MKYLLPPNEGTFKGPHTSEYTTLSSSFDLLAVLELNAFLGYLPNKQVSQTVLGISILGTPIIISLSTCHTPFFDLRSYIHTSFDPE